MTTAERTKYERQLKAAHTRARSIAVEYDEAWNFRGEACEHAVRRMELNDERIARLEKLLGIES